MEVFGGYVISCILGIVTGVLGTICYNKLHLIYEKRKREQVKRTIQPVNIFETYTCEGKNVIPIVSFGDSHAIMIQPLFENGICLLKANINFMNKPEVNTERIFVMALLSYLPSIDWSYYAECGYSLKFKIRGNIKAMRLEVKNQDKRKLIDEYVHITDCFEEKVYPLSGEERVWENVKEICFTVFDEEEYVQSSQGCFEIMSCRLEK